MKKYQLGKRRVARTQFKSLLLVGLLAGTGSAQQLPATPDEFAALPALPALAQLPSVPVSATSNWNARQHAMWILGLRARTTLQSDNSLACPELPSQTLGHGIAVEIVTPPEFAALESAPPALALPALPMAEIPRQAPQLPSDVPVVASSAAAEIALPGPADESLVMPVQFVDEGLPQVPAALQGGSSTVQSIEPPSLVTHAFSEGEPPRIGSGPIFAAPVPPLPLDELNASESLLSIDVSGIDPNTVDVVNEKSNDPPSLIDGLILPPSKPVVAHTLSDRPSATGSKATVTMHEGLAPSKVDKATVYKLSDDSKKSESKQLDSSSPSLVKSSASKVAMSLSDATAGSSKLPELKSPVSAGNESASNHRRSVASAPSSTKPSSLSLSDKQPTADAVVEKLSDTAKSKATHLSLNDKPKATVTKPGDSVIAKVDSLSIDEALAALDALPLPEARGAAPLPLAPTGAKSSESMSLLLPSKMIAQESPSTPTPIVAAQRMKLPDPVVDRSSTKHASPAVKTVSASMPKDDELPTSDEEVNYARIAAKLAQAVKQKFPDSRVRVSCNEDGLIVDGTVADSNEATKIMAFVRKTSLCPAADRLNCKR